MLLANARTICLARQVGVVLEGEGVVVVAVLEAADDEEADRQEHEHDREQEERHDTQEVPVEAATSRARRWRTRLDDRPARGERSRTTARFGVRLDYLTSAPTAASQFFVIRSFALFSWSRVGNTVPAVSGSLASTSAGIAFAVRQVLEADRVAVALQPDVLALVAVQELHPQLGRIRDAGRRR